MESWPLNSTRQYEDKGFPPTKQSLIGSDTDSMNAKNFEGLTFARPAEAFQSMDFNLFGLLKTGNMAVGMLGDIYFVSSVAALVDYSSELIEDISLLRKSNELGIYAFWLCLDGEWKETVVDDMVPTFINPNTKKIHLAFAQTVETNDLWLPLLQKAYAKSFGCYNNISLGDPFHVINSLTGAFVRRINDLSKKDELLKIINNRIGQGYLVVAVQTGFGKANSKAVLPTSIYRIIGVDPSEKIQTRELIKGVYEQDYLHDGMFDDGYEALDYNKFRSIFDIVGVCKLNRTQKYMSYAGEERQKAVYYFKQDKAGNASIFINQTDLRLRIREKRKSLQYAHVRVLVAQVTDNTFLYKECVYEREKIVGVETFLEPGKYVILVEFYTDVYFGEYRVCVNSEAGTSSIGRVYDDRDATFFDKLEQEIWRNYVLIKSETHQALNNPTHHFDNAVS